MGSQSPPPRDEACGSGAPPQTPRRTQSVGWRALPRLDPATLRLLGGLAAALAFVQYDFTLLTAALKHIALDLGMEESELGGALAAIRLGALPAILLAAGADRVGRRRLFLVSIGGASLATALTAASRSPAELVAAQMAARAFLTTALLVAYVIATEEFPAEHRGWGLGLLGALAALGGGLSAALFAAVDWLPGGWRSLFALGGLPALALPLFARRLPETRRFERARARRRPGAVAATGMAGWFAPALELARVWPGRAATMAAIVFLEILGKTAVFQFTGYYTLRIRGWAPWQYSSMIFVGGAVGILGHVVAGRLGDAIGRRIVGAAAMLLFPLFAWVFYRGPGWALAPSWALFLFFATAGTVIVRAFATELFSTSHRAAASGSLSVFEALAAVASLAWVGAASHEPGDLARATSRLSLVVAGAAIGIWLLPETRRRELEAISEPSRS